MTVPIYFWYPVLGCLGLGYIFMSVPPVSDQFMALFGVGYGGLSVFLSAIYWTHSASQVPAGLLIDRIGPMRSLTLCLGGCLLGSLLPFLMPHSMAIAIAVRLLLGLATGTTFLVLVKILKILTPPNHIARAQGAQGAAFCLGTMLPYLTLIHAGEIGWIMAYLSGAIFCVVLGLAALRLPRGQLRGERASGGVTQVWAAMKKISTSRQLWFLGCCHGFSYGSLNTVGNWLPSILADTRRHSTIEEWALATSAILLIGTLGRMFSGDASRLMPRQMLIRRATLAIGCLYGALALANTPLLVLIPAVALSVLCGGTYAAIFTLTIDISAPAYVATAVGFMNMVANGVNILLILVLGNARELTGGFGAGLCLASLAAIGLFFWGRRIALPEQ